MPSRTFLLAATGTRGDQLPVLTLGKQLRSRGHRVMFAGPPASRAAALTLDLEHVVAAAPFEDLLDLPGAIFGAFPWWHPPRARRLIRSVSCLLRRDIETQLQALPRAVALADVVVGGSLMHAASSVAEQARRPYLRLHTNMHAIASDEYPPPGVHPANRSRRDNARSWQRYLRSATRAFLPPIEQYRQAHGLGPLHSFGALIARERALVLCDEALAPLPSSTLHLPTWPLRQLGTLDAGASENGPVDWRLDELAAAPLYVGFGSMRIERASELVLSLVHTARSLGRPLVLHSLGTSLRLPCKLLQPALRAWADQHVLELDGTLALEPLLRRCWAALHHGGAGTVAAAARAGTPQLVMPLARGSDQPYWAHRVETLGVGVGPLTQARNSLERALSRLHGHYPSYSAAARELQQALLRSDRVEPGLPRVVALLEAAAER
jgi:UDP:flavonoid glycosyltransferase YjiC (YdhE family)